MPFIPDAEDLSIEESGGFEQFDGVPPATDHGWKDELNLAEFPIAALADRVPDGVTTLVFEDRLERKDHPPIVRRLTIMGTAKHGLPTSTDDEVLVGLIQLTKRKSNFTNAKVPFSRYELIELLGWPQSGASYRRIEEALHRWVGVVLMYENAWWDNTAKSWVDENFHVLDNVTLYDRERRRRASKASKAPAKPPAGRRPRKVGTEGDPLPLSSFRWNEVIFESFQSGNLKQFDLEFYLKLRLPTTKRMFRFLDKRFYRRERLDFDLKTLACEHIGMSRSYAPTELKRRLRPALEELEQLGFLEPLAPGDRYSWVSKGSWRILLIRARPKPQPATDDGPSERDELHDLLVQRGVSGRAAHDLVAGHPPGRVRTKVDVFDWLVKNQDKRVGKNPSGFLVASIKGDYETPGEFEAIKAKPSRIKPKASPATASAEVPAIDPGAEREAELRARWEQLPEADRESIRLAVRAANPVLGRWKKILDPLCYAAMDARPAPSGTQQKTLFPVETD